MSSAYFTVFTVIKDSVETNEKIDILHRMAHLKEIDPNINATNGESALEISPERVRLKLIIAERVLMVASGNNSFTLASGIRSKYYYDLRQILMDPESLSLIGRLILQKTEEGKIEAVGGLETGAISLAISIAKEGHKVGKEIRAFYALKKPLGSAKWFEGNLQRGDNVLIIDDVSTSGGSLIETIQKVRKYGCNPVLAISVIDREQGATEALKRVGVPFEGLFKHSEFEGLLK